MYNTKEVDNYRYGHVVTPFQKAGQNWDNILGMLRVHAYFWRSLSLINLIVSLLLAIVFLFLIARPQQTMMIVVVTSKGFVKNISETTHYFNNDKQYKEWAQHANS